MDVYNIESESHLRVKHHLEAPHLDQDEDPPVALDDSALLGAPPMRSKLGLPSRTSIKRNCSEQFRAMVEQVVEAKLLVPARNNWETLRG